MTTLKVLGAFPTVDAHVTDETDHFTPTGAVGFGPLTVHLVQVTHQGRPPLETLRTRRARVVHLVRVGDLMVLKGENEQ